MYIQSFCWNICGLNDPDKHRPFASWLAINKPTFGALIETHIKEPNLNRVMNLTCHGWHFTSNHNSDEDGRIVVIWKLPATVTVLHQSKHLLTCEITILGGHRFYFTVLYAPNLSEERTDLWCDLLSLQQRFQLDSCPWVLCGDFNQIIHPVEHSNSNINHMTSRMLELNDCLLQLELFDLRYQGSYFTWSNKNPLNPIAKKLDRLLVNNHWLSSYPDSVASFLAPEISDHSPCVLNLFAPLPLAGTKPFKFFNFLTKHPNFLQTIETAWILAGNLHPLETSLSTLSAKQKTLKREIKTLTREIFSDIQNRVRETNLLLQSVQGQAMANPLTTLFQQEREINSKYELLRKVEEAYFMQRSRINWLKEGDLNTAYFHRMTQIRNAFNVIRSFSSLSGAIIDDPLEMSRMAVSHFQSILGPEILQPLSSPLSWFQDLLSYRCSPEMKQSMVKFPYVEEIKKVMFKLNANKAPGPDGFTSAFYKVTWGIIGLEVTNSILQFFQTAFLPSAVNATILALVPKAPGASMISDFRPISCLNTLYKVVSKLLVSRLKPALPDFVLRNQSAFIKGRLLVENTLLVAELVNGYQRANGPKRITIKVDIAKAFDTVRWEFIFTCLRGIEVPELYLRWIKACICTPSFSVGFNDNVQGYFKGRRGLRQGDPRYLFLL